MPHRPSCLHLSHSASLSRNRHLCYVDFQSLPHPHVYLLGVCLPRDAGSPQWAYDLSALCCSPRKTYPRGVLRWHRSDTQQMLRGLHCAEKTLGCNTGAWAVVAASRSLVEDLAVLRRTWHAATGVEEKRGHCWRAMLFRRDQLSSRL